MDFGTSRNLDETSALEETRAVPIGAPYYMAPEQFIDGMADVRSDVYAFGAIVCEMVAGRRPVEDDTIVKIVQAHLHDKPRPPSDFATVPATLDAVVLRCLAKKPEERFQTIDEVMAPLDAAVAVTQADITHVVRRASQDARREQASRSKATEVLSALPQTAILGARPASDEIRIVLRAAAEVTRGATSEATQVVPDARRAAPDATQGAQAPALRVVTGPLPPGAAFQLRAPQSSIGRTRDLRAGDRLTVGDVAMEVTGILAVPGGGAAAEWDRGGRAENEMCCQRGVYAACARQARALDANDVAESIVGTLPQQIAEKFLAKPK